MLVSAATLLVLSACASGGSGFGTSATTGGGDVGPGTSTGSGTSTTTETGTTTGPGMTTGMGGDNSGSGGSQTTGGAQTTGGTTGAGGNTGAGGSTGAGGNTGTGGAVGNDGGPPATCPKGPGQICHEFYANDNGRHQINYVNEFTGDKAKAYVIWTVPAGDTSSNNSPRTIEVVNNPNSKSGKAVMVSLETGYAEFDTTNGAKLGQITGYTGISGACRLPDGSTALGQDNTIIIVSPTGTRIRNVPIPQGDNLRAINRNPADGHFWFSKTSIIYEVDDQGGQIWNGNMGAGTKGYAVWWRQGGGAYATTGDPSTVIEMDATGKIVSSVGGKGAMFPFLDFFSGFVRLPNGNYVVANWLGHLAAPSPDSPHVVEFAAPPKNEIVWKWECPTCPNKNQTLARQITNVYVYR
jgi:hypothetical protein